MASIARLSISWQLDTLAPTDVAQINPVLHNTGGVFTNTDWQNLTDALGVALDTYSNLHNQLTIKAYDVQGTPPVYPMATTVKRTGIAGATNVNRDLALCLSFYSQFNRPRFRGRLYVPCCIVGIGGTNAYASAANMTKVMDLGVILKDAGGVDVDWSVWSEVDHQARAVTDYYCDNNWDTQRRRGPRSTGRQSATTTELGLLMTSGFSPADGLSMEAAVARELVV